jgi:hypothetical protein
VGLEGDHEPNALEKDHDLNALGCPSAVGLEKDPEPKVGLGCPSSVGLDADTKGKVENQDPDSKDPYPKALEDEVVGMTIDEIKEL